MAKLWQVQRLADPVSPNFVERTTPDKYMPLVNLPRFDLTRSQYLHPAMMPMDTLQLTRKERTTPDKYSPLDNLPIWKPKAGLPVLADDSDFAFGSDLPIVWADRWHPEIQRPVFDLKRQQTTYPNESARPISTVFLERITPDKWHPELQRPRFDVARNQFLYPFIGAGPTSNIYTERITPDKFLPILPPFAWDVKRQQQTYPFVSSGPINTKFLETILLDKWWQEPNRPRFDLTRRQDLAPWHFGPVSTTFIELTTADRWHPDIERQLSPLLRLTPADPAFVALTVPVFKTLWYPIAPDFISRALFNSTGLQFSAGPVSNIFNERVSADRWHPEISRPSFDLKRIQALYPSLFFQIASFAERTTPDKYMPEIQRPVWKDIPRQYLWPNLAFTESTFGEVVFPDAWHPEIQRSIWGRAPRQYAWPYSFFQESIFQEVIYVDKWGSETSRPTFSIRAVYLLSTNLPVFPEVSPIGPGVGDVIVKVGTIYGARVVTVDVKVGGM